MEFRKNSTHEFCATNALELGADCLHKVPFFILIILACVTNEILKWLAWGGGGGSPWNCWWGCGILFLKW